ncbi:MAG TPA: glycerol-3-phosphate 1-O-acyltransferase PlsY [Gemmataceae bacterium]|jgi:acyl-phosphate glycerol 3-phosphate acyltransferase|nr:glycerol-3-phosphate 1-O-acyltransferase PlsY [Gemmataceae bacterium]
MILPVVFLVGAYLFGSVPYGFLIARWHGFDIRAVGSGNIGATNVGRLLGRKWGVLVFLLDFAKGAVPVLIARRLPDADWLPVAAGAAAFLGHLFPIWLKFQGGKGIATGAGVVFMLLPLPSLGALCVWLVVLVSTRYVSLSSIVAAIGLSGIRLLSIPEPFAPPERILTLFCLLATALVLARHAGNILRLMQNRENQLPESPIMTTASKVIHVLALGLWFGMIVFFTFVAAIVIFRTLDMYDSRLAGELVANIFPFYFLIQGICGLLAMITALGFTRVERERRVHRLRFYVVTLAVLTVIAAWPLNNRIRDLRFLRYDRDPEVAKVAKEQFGRWHTASLFLNFGTVALVTVAMGMAAALPARVHSEIGRKEGQEKGLEANKGEPGA